MVTYANILALSTRVSANRILLTRICWANTASIHAPPASYQPTMWPSLTTVSPRMRHLSAPTPSTGISPVACRALASIRQSRHPWLVAIRTTMWSRSSHGTTWPPPKPTMVMVAATTWTAMARATQRRTCRSHTTSRGIATLTPTSRLSHCSTRRTCLRQVSAASTSARTIRLSSVTRRADLCQSCQAMWSGNVTKPARRTAANAWWTWCRLQK